MKNITKYLAAAIDYYPHNLEMAIEALDYALSYDDRCTITLCLYGRLMSEQLSRFDEAKSYFERALASDIRAVEVYPYFIRALSASEDFEQACKLAEFASTLKGINRFDLAEAKIALFEKMQKFDEAQAAIQEAKRWHTCQWDFDNLESARKRIKLKRDLASDSSKPKPHKKKSKKKAAK